jgi:protein SHQ1
VDDKEENIDISYDCDTGVCHVKLRKINQGEHFEGLDMITSLLSVPKRKNALNPLIQETGDDDQGEEREFDDGDLELEWSLVQSTPLFSMEEERNILGEKYGFGNSKQNIFNRLGDEVALAIDLKEPDSKSIYVRKKEKIEDEQERFDEDYYLSCLFEDDGQLERLREYKPFWVENNLEFTEADLYDLKNLTTKKYLLDREEKKQMLLSLIDILFGFCYDTRINEGEDCSESHWNICKLSSTLSWLDSFSSVHEVVKSCFRRSLIFPLIRHYELSEKCLEDVLDIIKKGRKTIIICLLKIRRILVKTIESKYILNDIYINDFIVWIQRLEESVLDKVANSLSKAITQANKSSLDLDLDLLEAAAKSCLDDPKKDE